jgi:hypothetical protein
MPEFARAGGRRVTTASRGHRLRRSGRAVSRAALLLAVVFGAFMTGGFSPTL